MQRVYRSPGTTYNTFTPPRTGQNHNSRKSLAQYKKSLSRPVGYEEKDLGLPTQQSFDEENFNSELHLTGDNHHGYDNSVLL